MSTNRIRRVAAVSALMAAPLVGALALSSSASADPSGAKNSFTLQVVCDNGSTYSTVTNGNGHWTPAHDLNSTATLIPLKFGAQTFTITDQDHNVIQTQTTPPADKGSPASNVRGTQTSCTFSGGATDPVSGYTFSIVGSVLGFVTPAS